MTGIQGAAKFGFSDLELAAPADTGMLVRDQKVFRVGEFTSMSGKTRTWTGEDLDQVVQNFYLLRDQNIIPNVPVREDHTTSIKDVVAYITSVRRVGDFLYADWEFVSWEAKMKWDDKKYRNRSIEVGQYVTNQGAMYDPVVLGLAFVDLPAVEGLYRIANSGDEMPTNPNTPDAQAAADANKGDSAQQAQAAADAAAQPGSTHPGSPTNTPQDPPAGAPAVTTDDPPVTAPPAAPAPAPAAPAPQDPNPPANHAHGFSGGTFAFRLNGVEVSDHARVQNHIQELETFRTEAIEGARKDFVDSLVSGKVISGPQGVAFHGLVKTMSPDQFTAFKAGFEGMAPANLFARHDLGGSGDSGGPSDPNADRIAVLEGIVANHRAIGVSQEELAKKSSFIELQSLKSQTS